jgi:hypothetical protein
MREMNQDEKIADKYLKGIYSSVRYEPDGNIPPDFVVNDSIGVEVRRLNQQHRENGVVEGLEEQRISLLKAVNNELEKYPKDNNGNNFWLMLRYRRNIGKLKKIKKNIDKAIKSFHAQKCTIPYKFNLSENITLEFSLKSSTLSRKYKVGIHSDHDSSGWVVSMYIQDTTHCIEEKERKIEPFRTRYQSWWLLLIDHIDCMDNYDKEKIERNIERSSSFNRVIVIKRDGTNQFEI